jgi:hypothetical protein
MFLWQNLRSIPGAKTVATPGFGEAILLPVPHLGDSGDTFWMVGQYKDQTRLATASRANEGVQKFLAKHRVRFGFRSTDVPPAGLTRQEEYGKTRRGKDASKSFVHERVNPLTVPAKPQNALMTNRRGDRDDNVRTFWESQTQQSHHIVEYNHLNGIDASNPVGLGELDHGQLPCVLLAAEFHQRWVSSILKRTHRWDKPQLLAGVCDVYSSIYALGGPLRPLWSVSRLILSAAGVTVPAA